MKLFDIAWAVRLDPKDENGIPGMSLIHFTISKSLKDLWCREGINLKYMGYKTDATVRVKWVFPLLVLCPRKV